MTRDAIILGTRPEIIKCTPIIKAYGRHGSGLVVIHTNQHYSFNMDEVFFKELQLAPPDFNLNVGSGTHAIQTGKIMERVEALLVSEKIDRILVQGDTNTVLGAALAASKVNVEVAHVEAGLRSFDRTMPEEINRIVTDHVSEYLFCPTDGTAEHARREGIEDSKIHVVGNTIVDATLQNLEIASKERAGLLHELGVDAGQYNLVTAHRPANVDDPRQVATLVSLLRLIVDTTGVPVVFPVHPRTKANIEAFGLGDQLPQEVVMIDPVGYMDFLVLENNARFIFTDSGGVQEEACVLRKPCITLRENTERPETVDVGSNIVVGYDPGKLLAAIERLASAPMDYKIPFGDGTAGERIHAILHDSTRRR